MKTMNVNIHEIHTEVFTEEDQFGVWVKPSFDYYRYS